jgi:small multidrug resistance family-3 protein
MTIGELANQTGIPASTIRYYERVGVLPRPERISGKRRYSSEAVDRLAVVRLAQGCGFHLEEMRQLFQGFRAGVPPSRRWQELGQKSSANSMNRQSDFAQCARS